MITADQISALEAAAASWEGTPFCEGTPKKGLGCSCHHCVAEIYFEAGLISPRIPVPNGPVHWTSGQPRSLIVEWIEESGLFVGVTGELHPGDCLGFRLGHSVHHIALQLDHGRAIHSVVGHGVRIDHISGSWERRRAHVWRLKAVA